MSFKSLEKVYGTYYDISASEQAILVALAYRENDRTGLCYPSQNTLARMTHLGRASISRGLNSLKAKGFLTWISGGLDKRGPEGQALANEYTLHLPDAAEPSKRGKCTAYAEVMHKTAPDDAQLPHSDTKHCIRARQSIVSERDTNINSIKKTTEIGGRGRCRRSIGGIASSIDVSLREMGIAPRPSREEMVNEQRNKSIEASPLGKALHLCGFKEDTSKRKEAYRTLISEMLKCSERLGFDRLREIVNRFESDLPQMDANTADGRLRAFILRLRAAAAQQ